MPEGRMIKRRISDSKKLAKLSSDSPRLLYTWLIPWLDVEGRYLADPEIIKGHIFPKLKSWTSHKVEKCLIELDRVGLIILYEANGESNLQFTKFDEIQSIRKDREAPSQIPAPPLQTKSGELRHKLNKDNISKSKEKEDEISSLYKVRNYPFDADKDIEHIQKLKKEFPDVDSFELIKSLCAYWLDNPLTTKSKPRLQIRRWFINQKKWMDEAQAEKKVGESTKKKEIDHEFEAHRKGMEQCLRKELKKDESDIKPIMEAAEFLFRSIKPEWKKIEPVKRSYKTFFKILKKRVDKK